MIMEAVVVLVAIVIVIMRALMMIIKCEKKTEKEGETHRLFFVMLQTVALKETPGQFPLSKM